MNSLVYRIVEGKVDILGFELILFSLTSTAYYVSETLIWPNSFKTIYNISLWFSHQLPQMPSRYDPQLGDLIKSMLCKRPEDRPDVKLILRQPYIKRQIAMFLEATKE